MSAQFYVKEAKLAVDAIRRRLSPLGLFQDVDAALAVEDFASIAGECRIIRLPSLTEASGLEYLSKAFGLRIGDHPPSVSPLAGALCVADNARHRWILVREEDIPRRQRFTIAHELGHLFLEVESGVVDAGQSSLAIESEANVPSTVRMFSRCVTIDEAPTDTTHASRPPLSKSELLEVKADHFASELLMPYGGVRKLIHRVAGSSGIRTDRELSALADEISSRFDVSSAAARRRLEKDLAIVPIAQHHNRDLFSS